MSLRKRGAPGRGDRHKGQGRPVGSANPSHHARASVAPPALKPGQVRCPACRNATTTTPTGLLRKHADLFGLPCYQRAGARERIQLDELPPVVLPPERGGQRGDPREKTPQPPRPESRLDAGSECQDCGKWLPGERSVCGRCYVKRNESRL